MLNSVQSDILHSDQTESPEIELFRNGNLVDAVRKGSGRTWQYYAALGLIGKSREAIRGLTNLTKSAEAHFYLGVAYWMDGDDEAAKSVLKKNPLEYAKRLLDLIQKDRIEVLGQFPWQWETDDNKFYLDNIGYGGKCLPNKPYANIHDYYRKVAPPDFFVSQRCEQYDIPFNVSELACPLFASIADYSVHLQTVYPWLSQFDQIAVSSPVEWLDLRGLSSTDVITYPKLYGISKQIEELSSAERELDFFISGTMMSPFYPDKAEILHEVLAQSDINYRCIFGFSDDYFEYLKKTKISFAYVQHHDGMPTRAMESLAHGSTVLVQKGSVFDLYTGEKFGVVTYSNKEELLAAMHRILANWHEYRKRALYGAKYVRREFAISKVVSQYLRFFTYLAANPRLKNVERKKTFQSLVQKDFLFFKGFKNRSDARLERREKNNQKLTAVLERHPSPSIYIDLAKDDVLEYASATYAPATRMTQSPRFEPKKFKQALEYYREGIEKFPTSLVLRFNYIRACMHLGVREDVSQSLRVAVETINKPDSYWKIDPLEDLFPYDFFGSFFNYRDYFDLATDTLAHKDQNHPCLAALIIASINSYIGHYSNDPKMFKRAVQHDRNFPYYQYKLAETLLIQNPVSNAAEAGDLLVKLVDRSFLALEAYTLLEQLVSRGLYSSPKSFKLKAKIEQIKRRSEFVDFEQWTNINLKPVGIIEDDIYEQII